MPVGYSGTPLVRKLGIKPGMRIAVVRPPDDYWELLGDLPQDVRVCGASAGRLDFMHVFGTSRARVDASVRSARARIVPAGMIWVSWPKKASKVPTDVTEEVVRAVAFTHKLVDVKVCAVDAVWSGLKLVIRRRDR